MDQARSVPRFTCWKGVRSLIRYIKRYFLAGDEGKIDPWYLLAFGRRLRCAAWKLRLPSCRIVLREFARHFAINIGNKRLRALISSAKMYSAAMLVAAELNVKESGFEKKPFAEERVVNVWI